MDMFPSDAIGPAHTPNWDGRDDADQFSRDTQPDSILNIIASRDEEDEAGCVEVVVQKTAAVSRTRPRNEDEPVSPHVHVEDGYRASGTKQYHSPPNMQRHQHDVVASVQTPRTSPGSPYSVNTSGNNNSLLLNLTDLENSLNDEASTLKNLMIKIKSERDQLRKDKNSLMKQLVYHQQLIKAEETRHENEASRLTVELATVKSQLECEVQSLQRELKDMELYTTQERDQLVEQNQMMMDALIMEKTAEREKVVLELKESENQVQHLRKEIDETEAKLVQLTEEVDNRQITIQTLLDENRCFKLAEEESKFEIKRLQMKLEETTGDILRCFESDDDISEASGGDGVYEAISTSDDIGVLCQERSFSTSDSGKGTTITMLAVPNLDGENEALVCTQTRTEEFYPADTKEELRKLQFKLDVQVRVNEMLSTELVLLNSRISAQDEQHSTDDSSSESSEAKSIAESTVKMIAQLQEQLNVQVQMNEILSAELANERDNADGDAAIHVGKEIDKVKHEHKIEIKLLKKELAETKTMAKLLAKEYDSLSDAYAVEKKSNDELEKSLEEVVNLLMTERAVNVKNAEGNKIQRK